jgi:hypothetical protein
MILSGGRQQGVTDQEATMKAPIQSIYIPKGTIVGELRNNPNGKGIQERHITLCGDVYVDATKLDDGAWGYSVGKHTYVCCSGMATIL